MIPLSCLVCLMSRSDCLPDSFREANERVGPLTSCAYLVAGTPSSRSSIQRERMIHRTCIELADRQVRSEGSVLIRHSGRSVAVRCGRSRRHLSCWSPTTSCAFKLASRLSCPYRPGSSHSPPLHITGRPTGLPVNLDPVGVFSARVELALSLLPDVDPRLARSTQTAPAL